jgi:hypothetical protein
LRQSDRIERLANGVNERDAPTAHQTAARFAQQPK